MLFRFSFLMRRVLFATVDRLGRWAKAPTDQKP
jgi:hypothetical protein